LPPPATTFRPTTSDTFSGLPCNDQTCQSVISQTCPSPASYCTYLMQYSDYTNTTGYLATDTFTFDQIQVPDVVLGCSQASFGDFSGASGVLGFSRGDLSLVSQLHLSWFSYRLASDESKSGNLLQFGDDAVPQTVNSRSTPILNNSVYPDLYYVKLTGIMIDGR
ncbi:Aspartic proteinase nepenthesin-2, partial [Dichanthelium oligosanthes]